MEEQFILRVPPSIAERINRVLEENPSSPHDNFLDLSFSDDGRNGSFVIGNETFPASLLDLPAIVESYKSYDDSSLIKTADIGQIIQVREEGQAAVAVAGAGQEFRDGLAPSMRDARRRRFRRRPDINPGVVSRVEEDLIRIMAGGTAKNVEVEVVEAEEEEEEEEEENIMTAALPPLSAQKDIVNGEAVDAEMKDASESFESDDDSRF